MDKIPNPAWIAGAIVIVGLAYIFFVARPSLLQEECEAYAMWKDGRVTSSKYVECMDNGGTPEPVVAEEKDAADAAADAAKAAEEAAIDATVKAMEEAAAEATDEAYYAD